MSSHNPNLRAMAPDPVAEAAWRSTKLFDIDKSDSDLFQKTVLASMKETSKPRFPPLSKLPCANAELEKYKVCEAPGTMACSACKLVSYCSKKCQGTHWRVHKRDCRNFLRSEHWRPSWIVEGRRASFVTETDTLDENYIERQKMDKLNVGFALWGNIPAIDVINLANNEKDASRDFYLAFIASGDIRHIVHTINALPSNYSGTLNILLNDMCPPVVCRNLILLLVLGTIPDDAMAADIALHFWYSAFMPAEYRIQVSLVIVALLQNLKAGHDVVTFLNSESTVSFILPDDAMEYFKHYISDGSMGKAQDEYDRIRTAPSRRDFRDRMYAQLKPSHRIAFQEFRRFGIILPFGAMNAHFNVPNLSLFSFDGTWLQNDYADPLEGWDLDEVVAAGKAHGAQTEDIYGCLYFYLTDQLRGFIHRLRQFRIKFNLFPDPAASLSCGIRDGLFSKYGIPASVRFDRIEVSNILDFNYVGIRGVLGDWAPLLSRAESSAIVGYFMNWIMLQADGRVSGAGDVALRKTMGRIKDKKKLLEPLRAFGNMEIVMTLMIGELDVLYDNSKPFFEFLKKQDLDNILRETNLQLRAKHMIVPHRLKVPLHRPSDALPEFSSEESRYYYTQVSDSSRVMRFVEFSHRLV